MSNIQKQHKISPAIAWLTIQKFIIFYCPLDGEHTNFRFPPGGILSSFLLRPLQQLPLLPLLPSPVRTVSG